MSTAFPYMYSNGSPSSIPQEIARLAGSTASHECKFSSLCSTGRSPGLPFPLLSSRPSRASISTPSVLTPTSQKAQSSSSSDTHLINCAQRYSMMIVFPNCLVLDIDDTFVPRQS